MRKLKVFLLRIINVCRHFMLGVWSRLKTVNLRVIWLNRRRLGVFSVALLLFSISLIAFYFQYHTAQVNGAAHRQANTVHITPVASTAAATIPYIGSTSSLSKSPATPAVGVASSPMIYPSATVSSFSSNDGPIYPTVSAYPTMIATKLPTNKPTAIVQTAVPKLVAPTKAVTVTAPTKAAQPIATSTKAVTATTPLDPTVTTPSDPTATTPLDPTVTTPSDPTATTPLDPTVTVTPVPIVGVPSLTRLEQVTNNAYGVDGDYVPNSWGVQKNRIIRTSNGDIFMVYISAGSGANNREWHLMRSEQQGEWTEVAYGNAGEEEINILLGPHDQINLFVWPGAQGILEHLVSIDYGATFQTEQVPGQWIVDQGYSGSTIDPAGNMIIFQSGADKPGSFLWSYYSVATKQWTFHTTTFDYRYTYAFFFLGTQHTGPTDDLTITAMRDALRQELGYPEAASGDFNYIFNAIEYFHMSDISTSAFQQLQVAEVEPKSNNDADVTYILDSYVDSYGRTHIIYNDLYDGVHHVILEDGKVIKNVLMNVSSVLKVRITQDAAGHFYVITMSDDGKSLNVYPGTNDDSDGTQLEPAVQLDISKLPGCNDYDFCHEPTFTIPRAGNANSNIIDGVYGNYNKEIYFQINLHSETASSNIIAVTPASCSIRRACLTRIIDPASIIFVILFIVIVGSAKKRKFRMLQPRKLLI